MPPLTQLYIDGQFVPSSNGATFEVRNPYSGQVVGHSSSASSSDCKAAIEAAAKAFKTWESTSMNQRRDIFLKAADLVKTEKYVTKIMASVQEETSAAEYWGTFTWIGTSNFLRTQAGMLDQLKGETFPSGSIPGAQVVAQRRAMGVIFGIAPWNAPFTLSIRAIAVPILCGNTAILKSSEVSPRSQSIVVELFEEAGLPPGVLNFISMSRDSAPTLTAEIIGHPLVRSINFTGSDRVGKIIAMEAAKNLKPCVLELGGKAPAIVLNDANVAEAAKAIAYGSMAHSGQICMSTERVIVQRGIADQLISKVKELVRPLKAGDLTNDPSASLGALFAGSSADNIVAMIRDAKAEGAEVLLGDITKQGPVIQPHLLKNVKPGMRIWDRETFGPVAVFAIVDSIDEAIEMANASEYSLSASLWTSDLFEGQGIASQIRAGCTNINGPTVHSEPTDGLLGLGGASGYGRFHIENFTDKRVIVIHPLGRKYPLIA
ncbi:Aldehyde/histidinol dehydrogenase [Crassisporium funariophilum]|nr:Aldehyde/histidinol dehydrogenase [Crassisporium funariophilum]